MFCVVYEFTVKESQNEVFERSWADFTEAIFRTRGSLGSRLHTTDDSQVYIAYAQWPSESLFDKSLDDSFFTPDELHARHLMKESLKDVKTLYRLNVVDDHLRQLK